MHRWIITWTYLSRRPWKDDGIDTSLSSSTSPNGKPEINENERQQLIQWK